MFKVSAKTGEGIDDLRNALEGVAREASKIASEGGISNDRQRELIDEYLESLQRTEDGWKKGVSPEFIAFDLRQGYRALSRMLGKDEDMEDVLDEIFSRFCIGK